MPQLGLIVQHRKFSRLEKVGARGAFDAIACFFLFWENKIEVREGEGGREGIDVNAMPDRA
jgi:hypothetical protein